MLINCII